MIESLQLRQVSDPTDAAIAGFGEMQTAAYFAPETLIPSRYISQLLVDTPSPPRNFLLVAEIDGRVVGGTLFHWLADAGSGFSSFLGVERAHRGHGIARKLHEERLALLERASAGRVAGLFIDVVSPVRLPPEERERERKAGSDPLDRRLAFARFGFRQVDIQYEQPVGGPNGGPVTILDLLFRPREPSPTVPTSLVVATMRAYWGPWLGKEARRFAQQLEARAAGKKVLNLIPPLEDRSIASSCGR